jgi:hypothetical protein
MNTLSVDYLERGTDYQDRAQPQFRDRSPRDGQKRKHQNEYRENENPSDRNSLIHSDEPNPTVHLGYRRFDENLEPVV